MTALRITGLAHRYGAARVLRGVDLDVAAGEIVCLLGASGSGKSTLLRIVAGLEPLQSGRIDFHGEPLARPDAEPPPEARQFGLVFQDHVLFPHLSVAQNVAFGLPQRARDARTTRDERVAAQLAQVGLDGFGDRYPHTLSGGQQQRVALARALAPEPRLMLLDEPFASVDATLRRQLREDTRRVLKTSSVPAIVVTHDAQEAMELADRIAVMAAGRIVQCDTPAAVWAAPASRFVAELFGGTDGIAGTLQDGRLRTAFGDVTTAPTSGLEEGPCTVIARPNTLTVTAAENGPAVVGDRRFLGDHYLLLLHAGGESLRVTLSKPPTVTTGARVQVNFAPESLLIYSRS